MLGSCTVGLEGGGGRGQPYLLPFFNVPARRAVKLIAGLQGVGLLVSALLRGGGGLPGVQAVHVSGLDPNTAGG